MFFFDKINACGDLHKLKLIVVEDKGCRKFTMDDFSAVFQNS